MTATTRPETAPSGAQYVALAEFRHLLRRFAAFSETEAADAGLPPQQHQALLAIAGHVGPDPPGIGALAARLLVAPHTAAELVDRMVTAGLVIKTPAPADRRRVEIVLTEKARALLRGLSAAHLEELRTLAPRLVRALAGALEAPDGSGQTP